MYRYVGNCISVRVTLVVFFCSSKLIYLFILCQVGFRSSEMVDDSTRKTLSNIPLLQIRAGPREKDIWVQRLKEEYQALIKACT